SWYRMGFVVTPADGGANVSLSISYLPPKKWLGKLLSFLFADWYCDWCLQNMLKDTKSSVEIQHPLNGKA
ncbi:hypothetical protein, partial [Escherichia coli]|uniref:hypothetical protein n=1 Tax=Escherichia coli TaxID=562 RepID=UPI001BDCE90F